MTRGGGIPDSRFEADPAITSKAVTIQSQPPFTLLKTKEFAMNLENGIDRIALAGIDLIEDRPLREALTSVYRTPAAAGGRWRRRRRPSTA